MSLHTDSHGLLGRTIAGKFAVEAVIGIGGMGTVYRARQLALERTVALKVLHRDRARDDQFVERFKREARAASRLEHPNSVRVLDFGQEGDSLLYIAMEHVEGQTLLQILWKEGPLENTRIVEIMSQVLAAVGLAHEMGVVHRDLKPENIILVRSTSDEGVTAETAKVCDFGIATLGSIPRDGTGQDRNARFTTGGVVIGTPEYISPEQARGEALDGRSDLYSAGVVLYHLLTGRLPFQAETPLGLAMKHITDPPPPPSAFAKVDPALEAICLKAMSKAKKDRFETAREMRAALRTGIIPAGIAAAHADTPVLRFRSRRTRKFSWIAVVLALGAATIAAVNHLRQPQKDLGEQPAIGASSRAPPVASASRPVEQPHVAQPRPDAPPPNERPGRPRPTSESGDGHRSRSAARLAATVSGAAPKRISSPGTAAPATAPPVVPPPAVPSAPAVTVNVERATVSIMTVTTTSGIPGSNIRAAVARMPILRCYQDALRIHGQVASGTATLQLQIDVTGHVSTAAFRDGQFLPTMQGCIERAAKSGRIKDVDTGDATANVTLSFVSVP